MAKGTLQIAYDKLLLDNLELKERIGELEVENKELKESISQCHQAYHKTSVYHHKRIAELETTIKNACDLINDEGEVSKWKILNRLEPASK